MPLDFDVKVAPGGYAWWYFDGLSDDGERAFTAIFFVGSVFSPSYARRVARGERPRAEEHLGVNLALYHRGRNACWVMSEYGADELRERGRDQLAIAGSSVAARPDGTIRLSIAERSAPFMAALAGVGRRVRGTIDVEPLAQPVTEAPLPTAAGHAHGWRVTVPRSRVRVQMSDPPFAFSGVGYHDRNVGEGRLEAAFSHWSWARFHEGPRTTVLYAMRQGDGAPRALVVDVDDEGGPRVPVAASGAPDGGPRDAGWGFRLPGRIGLSADGTTFTCQPQTILEPSPFYARYLGQLSVPGRPACKGLGEHLDLRRFSSRGVQFLLRFKTRRVG